MTEIAHQPSHSSNRRRVVRLVAAAFVAWAALMLAVAVSLLFNSWAPAIDRQFTSPVMAALGTVLAIVGVALWRRALWAWYVAVILAAYAMLAFPFGTVTGGILTLCLIVGGSNDGPRTPSRTRMIFVIGLTVVTAVGAVSLPWRNSPAVSALGPSARPVYGAMFNLNGSGAWDASGGYVPVATDPRMNLVVYFDEEPSAGQPSMQVQIHARYDRDLPVPGSFVIASDLSAAQAQQVLVSGVPESLIDALVEAANRGGWAPRTPGSQLLGRTVGVPAAGHFNAP